MPANTIDFLRETAKIMTEDRPDVYDEEGAVEELSTAMDSLREDWDTLFGCIMFASYVLIRIFDDGMEEFMLSRKMTGLAICEEEEDVRAYSYLPEWEGLPFIGGSLLDDDEQD